MTTPLEIPTLLPALPEIVLALGAMLLLMVGVFRGEQATKGIEGGAVLLLLLAAVIVVWLPEGKLVTFDGSFVVDDFARFLKLLALVGSAAAIVMSSNYLAVEKRGTFEYSILIVLSTLGMMMLISAADLIALYLGLELMSLALYVVAAIDRNSLRSTEAGTEIFRARCAVVRHAALRRVAGLRLHRHRELCRYCARGAAASTANSD